MLAARQLFPETGIVRTGHVPGIGEHGMVPPADLLQGVAHRGKEIVVGRQDVALQVELDDGLGLVDRGELSCEVRREELLRRDVGGELDHLARRAGAVEDRIVGGLDPDLAAILADPAVLTGIERTGSKLFPELPVCRRACMVRVDEHRVVAPLDVLQRVTEGGQEVFVGDEDRAVHRELDDCLHAVEGCHLGFKVEEALVLPGRAGNCRGTSREQPLAQRAPRGPSGMVACQCMGLLGEVGYRRHIGPPFRWVEQARGPGGTSPSGERGAYGCDAWGGMSATLLTACDGCA